MNRIKSTFVLLIASVLIGISPNLTAQTLDEVLEGHFEAMAMDKVLKINSVNSTGKVIMMGGQMEMGYSMIQTRPNKSYTEMDFQGNKFVQVFTGDGGWAINPMAGPDAQPLTEEQVDQMKQQSYIEGILYNHKEKGYAVELVGEDEVEGSPTYKLKVIPQEGNGEDFFMHLDQDSYIIIKMDVIQEMQGQEVEAEIFLSNYKEVDGVPFPHSMEIRSNGQAMMEMIFENIKLNGEVDETLFESKN